MVVRGSFSQLGKNRTQIGNKMWRVIDVSIEWFGQNLSVISFNKILLHYYNDDHNGIGYIENPAL